MSQEINQVLETLPSVIQQNLKNVEFLIEEVPSRTMVREVGSRHLLGIYHGIPLPKRGRGYSFVMPDRIILYRKNIERTVQNEDEWKERVREVVLHEIGHYLGLNEEEVRKLMEKD